MSEESEANNETFSPAERVALSQYDPAPRIFLVVDAICLAGFIYVAVRVSTTPRPPPGSYEEAIDLLLRVAASIWPFVLNVCQYFYVSRRPKLVVRQRAVHRVLLTLLCWKIIFFLHVHR